MSETHVRAAEVRPRLREVRKEWESDAAVAVEAEMNV